MVSLKSSSSVEFEIEKIFLNFFLFSRSYRDLEFHVNTGCLIHFCSYSVIFVRVNIISI